MIKEIFLASSVATLAAASIVTLQPAKAGTLGRLACAAQTSYHGVTPADTSKLVPLKATRGENAQGKVRVNSKQWSNFRVSVKDDTTFRIRVTNANRYREKGNTFNNVVTFYDSCGTPLAIWYNQRGVGARGWAGYRTTHSNATYKVTENVVNKAAYVSFYSDNQGNSNRIAEYFKDVAHDGVKKGLTDLTATAVKMVGAELGIKQP
jgi:hypothetical protein